jgi:tripartite-type tricarboxylate transporter receptor subunit TctC
MVQCIGLRVASAAIALLALSGTSVLPQMVGNIKVVLPAPPGGAGDILARLLAEQVGRTQGRTIIIENRPGAGSEIAAKAVASAPPDGNTLMLALPTLLINPHLRKVSYEPITDFEPICYLVSSPGVIVVNGDSPYRTFDDLLAAARAKPGELTFASAGPGTPHHLGLEMLKRVAGVSFTYVPYPGGAPAINALLGAHLTAVFAEYAPLAEHLKTGKLRALVTTGRERASLLPDVSTAAETFKDYEVDFWWSLFAPAKTPNDTISQFGKWFTAAMQMPDVKPKLDTLGLTPVGTCGAEFAALIRKQFDEYGRLVREAKIKTE